MTTETPPAHDTFIAEFVKDSQLDDARSRELIAAVRDDTNMRRLVVAESAQHAAARTERLVSALQAGPGISKREAAVYILANMAASTSAATARRVLTDRLAILDDVAPL